MARQFVDDPDDEPEVRFGVVDQPDPVDEDEDEDSDDDEGDDWGEEEEEDE